MKFFAHEWATVNVLAKVSSRDGELISPKNPKVSQEHSNVVKCTITVEGFALSAPTHMVAKTNLKSHGGIFNKNLTGVELS